MLRRGRRFDRTARQREAQECAHARVAGRVDAVGEQRSALVRQAHVGVRLRGEVGEAARSGGRGAQPGHGRPGGGRQPARVPHRTGVGRPCVHGRPGGYDGPQVPARRRTPVAKPKATATAKRATEGRLAPAGPAGPAGPANSTLDRNGAAAVRRTRRHRAIRHRVGAADAPGPPDGPTQPRVPVDRRGGQLVRPADFSHSSATSEESSLSLTSFFIISSRSSVVSLAEMALSADLALSFTADL
ncbi:hypothetical protein QFZ75_001187 [Streptomyces sp. V3I8]|nr:hypothetical protein [Streptomyces sp. V3I8]